RVERRRGVELDLRRIAPLPLIDCCDKIQIERLLAAQTPGRSMEVREAPMAAGAEITIVERAVLERQPGDRGRALRLRFGARALGFREVFPVGMAALVLDQTDAQAIKAQPTHFELPAKQRDQLDADVRRFDGDERTRTEASRITEFGVSGFNREPGENRERKIAVQLQVAPGAIAYRLGDVILVVVRIDERDHGNA